MAPYNDITSTLPKLVVTDYLAPTPNHSLQWRKARIPQNSILPYQPYYTIIAPKNGSTSTAPCNGILMLRPTHQSGSKYDFLIYINIWFGIWRYYLILRFFIYLVLLISWFFFGIFLFKKYNLYIDLENIWNLDKNLNKKLIWFFLIFYKERLEYIFWIFDLHII